MLIAHLPTTCMNWVSDPVENGSSVVTSQVKFPESGKSMFLRTTCVELELLFWNENTIIIIFI